MTMALIIVVSVSLGMLVLMIVISITFGTRRKKLLTEVQQRYQGQQVLRQVFNASFIGQRSKGFWQIRGNGPLVLTQSELYFLRGVPRKELVIPLHRITYVSLQSRHLGKIVLNPLLCVEYHSHYDEDSVILAVNEPHDWKESIESARGVNL
ncbi:MAG: hypothetical protein SVM79_09590 [Chloroflexota bacterium]|nr:hypothetical protein [Chloroflexota bacterium]